jgi:tryptophan synthase beta subunit
LEVWWDLIRILIWYPFSIRDQRRDPLAVKEKTNNELPTHVIACVVAAAMQRAHFIILDEPSVQLVAVEAAGLGGG